MSEITSALIAHDDKTPFWIPAGTNKDDLEWPWMPDSSKSVLRGRHAWRTFVAVFGFDHTHRCSQRERIGSGLVGLAPPPSCGQLTRCFSAEAELLVIVRALNFNKTWITRRELPLTQVLSKYANIGRLSSRGLRPISIHSKRFNVTIEQRCLQKCMY